MGSNAHEFGGDWTRAKLRVLGSYLQSYATVLKDTPFHLSYIDAFAGSGSIVRRGSKKKKEHAGQGRLVDMEEAQGLLDGSARIALQTDPPFGRYIFIDAARQRCQELERLREEYPELSSRIEIMKEDANDAVRQLCHRSRWTTDRAVLFLDPYGMQVEWDTIRVVAGTHAIDMWLLFPLGVGVNRLLKRSGDIPPAWGEKLDSILGTGDWREALYHEQRIPNLFGEVEESVLKASMSEIGQFFVRRLQSIFPGVSRHPGVLRNSKNCPLYLLCFAAANERGADIALRIANHLLRGLD